VSASALALAFAAAGGWALYDLLRKLLADRLPADACRWVADVGHDPFAPAMRAASHAAWSELLALARPYGLS